jgi:hypothetical protein
MVFNNITLHKMSKNMKKSIYNRRILPSSLPVKNENVRRYVVLDMDEMMIHARTMELIPISSLILKERIFYVKPIQSEAVCRVIKRKYLDYFLDELEIRGYHIIVWSAGIATYVKDIISVVMYGRKIEYLFTREHLTNNMKDLRTIEKYIPGFQASQCRLIDDNPIHEKGQEELVILVKPFIIEGENPTPAEDDNVLSGLVDRIDRSFRS